MNPSPTHPAGRFSSGKSRGTAGLENNLLRTDGEMSDRAGLWVSGVEGVGSPSFDRGKSSEVDSLVSTAKSRARSPSVSEIMAIVVLYFMTATVT